MICLLPRQYAARARRGVVQAYCSQTGPEVPALQGAVQLHFHLFICDPRPLVISRDESREGITAFVLRDIYNIQAERARPSANVIPFYGHITRARPHAVHDA